MSTLRLELRHSSFRYLSPAIAALATVLAVSSSYPSLSSWADILQSDSAATLFVAPFLAGFGAWEGLRAKRRRLLEVEATATLSLFRIRAPQYLAAMIWIAAGSISTILFLVARGAILGLDGAPNVPGLTEYVIALLYAATVGFLGAQIIRHWVVVIVAVATVLGGTVSGFFPFLPHVVTALDPLHSFAAGDGLAPNTQFFVGISVVAIALAFALLAIAMARDKRRDRSAIILFAIIAASTFFLGSSVVSAQGGNDSVLLSTKQEHWITIHSPAGHVQLKMLSLYAPVSQSLARAWGRVGALTSTSDLHFSALIQDTNPDYKNAPSRTFYRLDLNPSSAQLASDSIFVGFNDVAKCATHSIQPTGNWSLEGTVIVETWFAGVSSFQSGVSIPDPLAAKQLHALQQLTGSQARAWVRAHESEIRSCAWNRSDFP